ncbi:MAG: hypothetical protein FWF68_05020 [Spirochaetes bacterium]|nr:hypothetical protein [Spirochaetota bacterium]
MKKFLMTVGLMLVLSAGVFAQAGKTNYYRYVETVDTETGVRSKGGDHGIYITFTRNSCYDSDEKGVQTKNRQTDTNIVFAYQGEQNNLYVYKYLNDWFAGTYSAGMYVDTNTYTFSKDYRKLNTHYKTFMIPRLEKEVHVYELADPPSKGPDTFY